jgi:hypothetical protein
MAASRNAETSHEDLGLDYDGVTHAAGRGSPEPATSGVTGRGSKRFVCVVARIKQKRPKR